MLTVVLTVLGGLLLLAGIVGCVLPILPGPPLSYLSLLLLSAAHGWRTFSPLFLGLMALLAVLVTALDFIVPAAGARRAGASRAGTWGSILGMFAGLFLGPFGILLGALGGALLGELLAGRTLKRAWIAAWGVFKGTIAATLLKLMVCGVYAFEFFAHLRG